MNPLVSVLLPVYNGETYLSESIQSILSQTYTDLELIIVDDGSSDSSWDIISSFSDTRVQSYRQKNAGLAHSLNLAIKHAKGVYLARQDQDDISLPTRISEQVTYLEQHPACGLLGTWAGIMVGDTLTDRRLTHPSIWPGILLFLCFDNAFVHSSVMMRKQVVLEAGGYDVSYSHHPPEDYDLWSRMIPNTLMSNIPQILLHYRETPGSMSRKPDKTFMQRVVSIGVRNMRRLLPAEPYEDILELLSVYHHVHSDKPVLPWTSYEQMLKKLRHASCVYTSTSDEDVHQIYEHVYTHLHDQYATYCYSSVFHKIKRYVFG